MTIGDQYSDTYWRQFIAAALRDRGYEGDRNAACELYREFHELRAAATGDDTLYWHILEICLINCIEWHSGRVLEDNWIATLHAACRLNPRILRFLDDNYQ